MRKYIFLSDKDLNYVYKRGFVYKDKDGNLQRVHKDDIKEYYENLEGRFKPAQIYYMIEQANEDCNKYIELHKDDKPVELPQSKKGYKGMDKQEYINYLINAGYSDVDAEEKAECYYDSEPECFDGEWDEDGEILYTLKQGDIILGKIKLNPENGYISCLYTNPDYRKSGVGIKLITHAIKNGGKQAAIFDNNIASLSLFKKLGFEVVSDNGKVCVVVLPQYKDEIDQVSFDQNYDVKFEIDNGTLEACNSNDTKIIVPNNVDYITNEAFELCNNLEELVLSDSVFGFDDYSFYMQVNLKKVSLGSGIKDIPNYAFSTCENLQYVEMKNVESISIEAFLGCRNLINIKGIEKVNYIDDDAFYGCKSLNKKCREIISNINPNCKDKFDL